jgi:hypothetical protein
MAAVIRGRYTAQVEGEFVRRLARASTHATIRWNGCPGHGWATP